MQKFWYWKKSKKFGSKALPIYYSIESQVFGFVVLTIVSGHIGKANPLGLSLNAK
jgi:hypothetical protein